MSPGGSIQGDGHRVASVGQRGLTLRDSPSALQHRDFNDKLLDSQSIRKMDPNPKPDPQDHGKPAGEGGGNSKSSDDAPIIDEDATFRNAAYFGNEEGSKDKDGGSQKK
ncbi:hypothetical protein VDGE_20678 [Verticillium dahliae]|uniref:Uncharacterized protein n=1 Tax=Verticillium dahliae TaxID=27337 RepID=A0A444RJG5_VERDA|nr:hypothetical protein VDGE_20678 [Verticillium dahliae]